MSAGILLVETAQGATVGVRFPDDDAARAWEDQHDTELTAVGWVPIVNRTEALRLANPQE